MRGRPPERVLVIGDDMRIFLTLVRSLGRAGKEVHAAPFNWQSPALRSKYISAVHYFPRYSDDPAAWQASVLDVLRSHSFDLVVPCCDPERYGRDFGLQDHPSCLESIRGALLAAGETWTPRGELAWNVFMHNTITPDGEVVTEAPGHGPGDHVELEALDDLGVVASSCPQDLTPCNGWKITPVAFRVYAPAR